MKKTTLKNVLLMLVFAITTTSVISIKASLAITVNDDINPDLNPTPDLVKTLNDGINLKNFYSGNTTSFAPFEARLDEFFYHQLDTTFTDLYDYMTNPKKPATAQEAIDWAKGQQATKGGDPAALKACNDSLTTCTATVANYATEGAKLQTASKNFYDYTSTPNNYIAGYVQAFIKYADGTDVYKDMAGKELFEGKKWLENYFNPTTCILPALTDFYEQILSAITANSQGLGTQWKIVADLTPTKKSISDNMDILKTQLNVLNPAQKTCPENDCSKCPTDYSNIKSSLMSATENSVYMLTFSPLLSKKSQLITNKNPNYLNNPNYYGDYIGYMITLINNVTEKLFSDDEKYTNDKQAWFDDHIVSPSGTFFDTGIPLLKEALISKIDAVLAAQNNNAPATSKIDPTALTALNALEATIKSLIEDLDPNTTTSNIYDLTTADAPTPNSYKNTKDFFDGGATAVYNKTATHANNIVSQLKAVYAQLDQKDTPSNLDSIPTIDQLS